MSYDYGHPVLSLTGCLVAESTFLNKAEEADHLSKGLADLRQKYEKLTADNSSLKADYDKLKAEAAGLAKDK